MTTRRRRCGRRAARCAPRAPRGACVCRNNAARAVQLDKALVLLQGGKALKDCVARAAKAWEAGEGSGVGVALLAGPGGAAAMTAAAAAAVADSVAAAGGGGGGGGGGGSGGGGGGGGSDRGGGGDESVPVGRAPSGGDLCAAFGPTSGDDMHFGHGSFHQRYWLDGKLLAGAFRARRCCPRRVPHTRWFRASWGR